MEIALDQPQFLVQSAVGCPRCGYDQSGAIHAWERLDPPQCPLKGLCSECGLELDWVDVLRPDRERLPGFFEHAQTWREWLTSPWRTLWLVARPGTFWTRVPLAATPVVGRIVLWPAFTLAAIWIIGSLIVNLACWRFGAMRMAAGWQVGLSEFAYGWLDPFFQVWWPGPGFASMKWWFDPRRYLHNLAPAFAMTLVWPFLMLVLRDTTRAAQVRRSHVLRAAGYSLAWLVPLAMLHAADGVWWLATIMLGPRRLVELPSQAIAEYWPALVVGIGAWLAVWWLMAIRRGFQLRRGWAVWGLLLPVSVLAGIVAAFWFGGAVRYIARHWI